MNEEFLEMDEDELNEKLVELQEEKEENNCNLAPYEDDIEEGNFDGDSIEYVAHTAEIDSEVDEVLKVMKHKDIDIPEGYQHRAEEL